MVDVGAALSVYVYGEVSSGQHHVAHEAGSLIHVRGFHKVNIV